MARASRLGGLKAGETPALRAFHNLWVSQGFIRGLFEEQAGQFGPVGHFPEGMRPAVPGLGEEDGGDAVLGQLQAGLQAIFHEVLDLVVQEEMKLGGGVAGGHHADGITAAPGVRGGASQVSMGGPGPGR